MPRRASSDNVVKLNKSLVSTLRVDGDRTGRTVWDADVLGLGLRLRKSGNAAWIIRPPRKGGASRIFTLGALNALSLSEARAAAKEKMASATLGTDPLSERKAAKERAAATFGSELPRYLERAQGKLRPSSYGDVRRYLEVSFKPLHALPVLEIKRAHVATRLREIADTSGPYAASRARAALSACFVWLIGEGRAEFNPVVGTNRLAKEIARDRVLSDAELKAVWLGSLDTEFGRIVRLLILTGQRREEVAGMRWSELDLQAALWKLPPARVKNSRAHDVPLSAPALEILSLVPVREGRDLLFGQRKGAFSGFSKSKAELDHRIGLAEPWRLHDLRRTSATGMATIGVLPHIVEAILNHASGAKAGVAGVYNRSSYAAEKRDALDRWGAHVAALVKSG